MVIVYIYFIYGWIWIRWIWFTSAYFIYFINLYLNILLFFLFSKVIFFGILVLLIYYFYSNIGLSFFFEYYEYFITYKNYCDFPKYVFISWALAEVTISTQMVRFNFPFLLGTGLFTRVDIVLQIFLPRIFFPIILEDGRPATWHSFRCVHKYILAVYLGVELRSFLPLSFYGSLFFNVYTWLIYEVTNKADIWFNLTI